MLDESNCILLFFTRSVDVSKKEWDVMPTHKGHDTLIIKEVGSLVVVLSCIVRFLTCIDGFIRYLRFRGFGLTLASGGNFPSD